MKATKKQIREYSRIFTHILTGDIKNLVEQYKTERGLITALNKRNEENRRAHTAPIPAQIIIDMTWRKSIYGWCSRAEMRYFDAKGWHYIENAAFAGGYGYDKTSTILAECLNTFSALRWSLRKKNYNKKPYGVYKSEYKDGMFFDGGIGESSYYDIALWMGYKMEHVASGKTYDKFIFTRKGAKI